MRTCDNKRGFTLVEAVTVVAIIAVLISAVLGLGTHLKQQADERLAQSTVDVLVTAVEQYYEFTGEFPFTADVSFDESGLELVLNLPAGQVLSECPNHLAAYSSSEALYYTLDNCVRSKSILDSLGGDAVTNKDAAGEGMAVTGPSSTIDLVRVVDPWGNALQYTYAAGDTFPELRFAGRDGLIGTEDDVTSTCNCMIASCEKRDLPERMSSALVAAALR